MKATRHKVFLGAFGVLLCLLPIDLHTCARAIPEALVSNKPVIY